MARIHVLETHDGAGNVVERKEVPWTREDYIGALEAIDLQITPRRLSDAARGVSGAVEWLNDREAEKQALREELNALG